MELKKEIIDKNYNEILENIKKHSPYPERVKILFIYVNCILLKLY